MLLWVHWGVLLRGHRRVVLICGGGREVLEVMHVGDHGGCFWEVIMLCASWRVIIRFHSHASLYIDVYTTLM